MATSFQEVISHLRQAEHHLAKQLEGVRNAISSLEMGGAVSPAMPSNGAGRLETPAQPRKRRRLSAKARAAISAAQKARWAKVRAGQKKR